MNVHDSACALLADWGRLCGETKTPSQTDPAADFNIERKVECRCAITHVDEIDKIQQKAEKRINQPAVTFLVKGSKTPPLKIIMNSS